MSGTKNIIKTNATIDEAAESAKEGGDYVASTSLHQESTSDDKEKTANIRATAAKEAEDDSIANREEEKERLGCVVTKNQKPDNRDFEVAKETSWFS